jgi:hypothetical protein
MGLAVRAVRARFAACRPGYSFEFGDGRWQVRCVDGSVIGRADASPALHAEAATCLSALAASLGPSAAVSKSWAAPGSGPWAQPGGRQS